MLIVIGLFGLGLAIATAWALGYSQGETRQLRREYANDEAYWRGYTRALNDEMAESGEQGAAE